MYKDEWIDACRVAELYSCQFCPEVTNRFDLGLQRCNPSQSCRKSRFGQELLIRNGGGGEKIGKLEGDTATQTERPCGRQTIGLAILPTTPTKPLSKYLNYATRHGNALLDSAVGMMNGIHSAVANHI